MPPQRSFPLAWKYFRQQTSGLGLCNVKAVKGRVCHLVQKENVFSGV